MTELWPWGTNSDSPPSSQVRPQAGPNCCSCASLKLSCFCPMEQQQYFPEEMATVEELEDPSPGLFLLCEMRRVVLAQRSHPSPEATFLQRQELLQRVSCTEQRSAGYPAGARGLKHEQAGPAAVIRLHPSRSRTAPVRSQRRHGVGATFPSSCCGASARAGCSCDHGCAHNRNTLNSGLEAGARRGLPSVPVTATLRGNRGVSPQSLLLFPTKIKVSLDHPEDMLGLIVGQTRQVQLPAHDLRPNSR